MFHYTPLRYPGGKRRLTTAVTCLLEHNGLMDIEYAEPFVGGGGVGLALLFQEYASTIHLNDLSRPIYAIWHTILHENQWLCERIKKVKVTMREWNRRRAVFDREKTADLDELGFSALFLNRTNRSGIIGGGVIGGKSQDGSWKMDARFNKDGLIDRIKKIGRYRDRVNIYQMDANQFANQVIKRMQKKAFVFFDPPYIERSPNLYLNSLKIEDHRTLATTIGKLKCPWIVTYDTAALDQELYKDFRRMVYSINYVAHQKHCGEEVMFLSDGIKIPNSSLMLGDRMRMVASKSRFRT